MPQTITSLRASQKSWSIIEGLKLLFSRLIPSIKRREFAPQRCQPHDECPRTCLRCGISILSGETQVADLTRNMRQEKRRTAHSQSITAAESFRWVYKPALAPQVQRKNAWSCHTGPNLLLNFSCAVAQDLQGTWRTPGILHETHQSAAGFSSSHTAEFIALFPDFTGTHFLILAIKHTSRKGRKDRHKII